MRSIHANLWQDFLYFYAPSFLFLLGVMIPNFWTLSIVTFFVFVILDIGHAYSTLLRTYFSRNSSSQKPILAPLLFILGSTLYCYLGLPHFWALIIYFTYFHHIRQNYGLYMWYCKLSQYKNKWHEFNIHFLAITTFILYHARQIDYIPLYDKSEFIKLNFPGAINYLFMLYSIYFFITIFTLLISFYRKKISGGLAASVIYPSSLSFICFLFFDHSIQTFIPLLVLHATTYLSLIGLSSRRLEKENYNPTRTWFKIIAIIIFFGIFESYITDYFDILKDSISMKDDPVISFFVSLSVLPNLMHYYLDGKIWKKKDSEFRKIISLSE